jgi:hypothetical protein
MLSMGFTIVRVTCSILAPLSKAVFYMISGLLVVYNIYKGFLDIHLADICICFKYLNVALHELARKQMVL